MNSWTPNDYAAAAGRSCNGKEPSAMDFMTRLDADVSAIDFNSSILSHTKSSSSGSVMGLVKIHKRERSPLASSPTTAEATRKKKYKLVENTFIAKSALPTSSSDTSLHSFAFSKTQLPSVDNQNAPEDRIGFLKVVCTFKAFL